MRYALLPVAFRRRGRSPSNGPSAPRRRRAIAVCHSVAGQISRLPAAGGRLVVRRSRSSRHPDAAQQCMWRRERAQAAPSELMRREFLQRPLHVAERNSFLFQADPRSDPVKLKILE